MPSQREVSGELESLVCLAVAPNRANNLTTPAGEEGLDVLHRWRAANDGVEAVLAPLTAAQRLHLAPQPCGLECFLGQQHERTQRIRTLRAYLPRNPLRRAALASAFSVRAYFTCSVSMYLTSALMRFFTVALLPRAVKTSPHTGMSGPPWPRTAGLRPSISS